MGMTLERLEHDCNELEAAGLGYCTPYVSASELMVIMQKLRTGEPSALPADVPSYFELACALKALCQQHGDASSSAMTNAKELTRKLAAMGAITP